MHSMTDFSAIALLSGGLDSATAAALAQEAGGRVTDTRGGEVDIFGREVVASNAVLHEQILGNLFS